MATMDDRLRRLESVTSTRPTAADPGARAELARRLDAIAERGNGQASTTEGLLAIVASGGERGQMARRLWEAAIEKR